ncbi:MAG: cation:proton antiporter [Roseburia sp.]|nr:cation:proton antiporter [Roseburia sp.]
MFEGNSALGFVAVLAIILFSTKFLGLVFRHFGLPQVLGFIIAGILIGPAIFGEFAHVSLIGFEEAQEAGRYHALFILPEADNGLAIFSKIGVLLLMFSTGLETNLKELKNTGLTALLVAFAGVLLPLILGFAISLPFGDIGLGFATKDNIFRSLFIGVILTATSVAITVSVLKELGKINTKLGTTIVSAAIIDDVIGIVLLSVVTGMAKSGAQESANAFEAFKTTAYGTVIMIVCFFIFAIAAGWVLSKCFKWMDKRWPTHHRIPVFSLAVCFGYSWLAEEIFGVADITGAFLAGVVLSTDIRASRYTDSQIEVNTYTIFSPVFFANIGISSITFVGLDYKILLFAVLAVILGVVGKVVGCGGVFKAFGYGWRESAIGGTGMAARGEVALIVTAAVTDASLGAARLDPKFMFMTVLLILVSSVLTPILLKVLYGKEKKPPESGGGEEQTETAEVVPEKAENSESAETPVQN